METIPEYDITDIANWFLCKSNQITHKKLQKLCYFAVAWNWGINKEPLCKNAEFQAWIHGAVNPLLYKKYKKYGWKYIPKRTEASDIVRPDIIEFLESVYDCYGEYNGHQLESICHQDEPYLKARGDLDIFESCTNIIQKDDMIQYYGELFEKNQSD